MRLINFWYLATLNSLHYFQHIDVVKSFSKFCYLKQNTTKRPFNNLYFFEFFSQINYFKSSFYQISELVLISSWFIHSGLRQFIVPANLVDCLIWSNFLAKPRSPITNESPFKNIFLKIKYSIHSFCSNQKKYKFLESTLALGLDERFVAHANSRRLLEFDPNRKVFEYTQTLFSLFCFLQSYYPSHRPQLRKIKKKILKLKVIPKTRTETFLVQTYKPRPDQKPNSKPCPTLTFFVRSGSAPVRVLGTAKIKCVCLLYKAS